MMVPSGPKFHAEKSGEENVSKNEVTGTIHPSSCELSERSCLAKGFWKNEFWGWSLSVGEEIMLGVITQSAKIFSCFFWGIDRTKSVKLSLNPVGLKSLWHLQGAPSRDPWDSSELWLHQNPSSGNLLHYQGLKAWAADEFVGLQRWFWIWGHQNLVLSL